MKLTKNDLLNISYFLKVYKENYRQFGEICFKNTKTDNECILKIRKEIRTIDRILKKINYLEGA